MLSKVLKRAAKTAAKLEDVVNNERGKLVHIAKLPRDSILARARMRGWNDVVNGKGYRDSYDDWPTKYKRKGRAMQFAYERGRQEASMAKGAALARGKAIDAWSRTELVQGPMYRACGAVTGEKIINEMRKNLRRVK